MNKKILIPIVGLLVLAAMAGIAKADIKVSIEVKDSNAIVISEATVPINTIAYVYGHYEDQSGNSPASALMEAYFDDGSGLVYRATLFSGTVNDGDTIMGTPYTMTELGTYEFRWTCTKQVGTGEITVLCRQERAQARTRILLVIPEPGTLAGLIMALSAFGLLATRKIRAKLQTN